MRRFFLKELPDSKEFTLPEEESKHIVRVLRMQVSDRFLLLDGKGIVSAVEITEAHPKRCAVRELNREAKEQQQLFHLAIAPTKNLDRMEWMVEKIAEIGATDLTFLVCEHSERVNLKSERLERVAISAMKQAEQDFLLRIHPLTDFTDFVAAHPNGAIAYCGPGEKTALAGISVAGPVLIGPEGDFSPKEVEEAIQNGYKIVHLGTSRLRTETAGMVATALVLAH